MSCTTSSRLFPYFLIILLPLPHSKSTMTKLFFHSFSERKPYFLIALPFPQLCPTPPLPLFCSFTALHTILLPLLPFSPSHSFLQPAHSPFLIVLPHLPHIFSTSSQFFSHFLYSSYFLSFISASSHLFLTVLSPLS